MESIEGSVQEGRAAGNKELAVVGVKPSDPRIAEDFADFPVNLDSQLAKANRCLHCVGRAEEGGQPSLKEQAHNTLICGNRTAVVKDATEGLHLESKRHRIVLHSAEQPDLTGMIEVMGSSAANQVQGGRRSGFQCRNNSAKTAMLRLKNCNIGLPVCLGWIADRAFKEIAAF